MLVLVLVSCICVQKQDVEVAEIRAEGLKGGAKEVERGRSASRSPVRAAEDKSAEDAWGQEPAVAAKGAEDSWGQEPAEAAKSGSTEWGKSPELSAGVKTEAAADGDGEKRTEDSRAYYSTDNASRDRSGSRGRERGRSPAGRDRQHSSYTSGRGKGRSDSPPAPSKVIGAFGLSNRTRRDDLERLFGEFGAVERVHLIEDRRSGQSRGFAFVYFERIEDAEKARTATNGMDFMGKNIRVDFSKTGRPHSPTPGRYMGPPSRFDRERERDRERYGRGDRDRDYRDRERDRDYRDSRDRDYRDSRDSRDSRDNQDSYRSSRDSRDYRDSYRSGRDSRDYRDSRDSRDYRDNGAVKDGRRDRDRERSPMRRDRSPPRASRRDYRSRSRDRDERPNRAQSRSRSR